MSQSVYIPARLRAALQQHAAAAYPAECCGILLGRRTRQRTEIAETVPAANRDTRGPHARYLIAPRDYLETERAAARRGLDVVGFYHSHPDMPVEPSSEDLKYAWPNVAYLIGSVMRGVPGMVRAFVLSEQRDRFHPMTIEEGCNA